MGVSFYAVVEYKMYDSYVEFGRLDIPRDHELFSAIALGDGGVTDDMPYPPRGLPRDLSFDARDLFYVEADEVKEHLDDFLPDGGAEITSEQYAAGYGAWAVEEYEAGGGLPAPETYSHGWLNLDELKQALARRGLDVAGRSPAFRAASAAMEVLAEEYGAENVRLVFGFGL